MLVVETLMLNELEQQKASNEKASGWLGTDSPLWQYASHVEELRQRIAWCLLTWVLAMAGSWLGASTMVGRFKAIAQSQYIPSPTTLKQGLTFIQTTPGEVLGVHLKLAVIGACVFSLPVVGYHVARFLMPGLKKHEIHWLLALSGTGLTLFFIGLWVGIYFILPPTLAFFWQYGQGDAQPYLSISTYVEMCLLVTLLTGVLCELPILVIVLGMVGIVKTEMLLRFWRETFVVALILAAVITPSQDPFTMILVTVLLVFLLGVSTLVLKLLGK